MKYVDKYGARHDAEELLEMCTECLPADLPEGHCCGVLAKVEAEGQIEQAIADKKEQFAEHLAYFRNYCANNRDKMVEKITAALVEQRDAS